MAGRQRQEPETDSTGGVLPALLFSAILANRILLACLERTLGERGFGILLHNLIHLILLFALVYVPYRSYRVWRSAGPGRAAVYCLLACLAAVLVIAQTDRADRLQILLYFPLGAALYRERSAGGRNAGIRCFFDIFLLLCIAVLTENILRGFLPAARFTPGLSHVHAMGMAGAFFARNLDTQRPYRFARTSRPVQHGGAAPLLDLHLFGRDLVLLLALAVLFLLQDGIVSFYRTGRVAGDWRVQGAEGRLLRMTRDGRVLCKDGEAGWVSVRRWGIEGNLLDGFFLFLVPPRPLPDGRCSFLNPWVEARRRFRLRGDAVVFDQATPSWRWPLKTLLGRKPGEGAVLWERVR